jgi:heme-degrading monooxygenase HmoA
MAEIYTTGSWTPKPGEEQAFVDAWREFAGWANRMPGAGTLRLARDSADATKFVSFGRWDNFETAHAWKASPEFRERMGRVQRHVAEFRPAELEVVATIRHAPAVA